MSWFLRWGNPIIATGVLSFVMHEVRGVGEEGVLVGSWAGRGLGELTLFLSQVVYFARCIPWLLIDRYGQSWANKYVLRTNSSTLPGRPC